MLKKFVAIMMTGAVLFTAAACGDEKSSTQKPTTGEVKVWTAYGTEKIMQDMAYDRNDATLEIKAFRNEYESGQIILSPDYDVREYTLTLSDLKSGENTLSKEQFTVYNQKYLTVDEVLDKSIELGAVAGNYPDALLPMDAAVEYDENTVAAGKNQGIWITLKVPKEQAAGVYTGNFILHVDGKTKTVPVKITVWDYAISDESHSKSTYAVYLNQLAQGEQERTVAMEKAYVDYLLDYRMSPQQLPTGGGLTLYGTEEQLEEFLDAAVEYTKNVKCSYFNLPYMTESKILDDGEYGAAVDLAMYEKLLRAMVVRSYEEGVNLFSKTGNYLLFADEAEYQGLIDEAKYSAREMKNTQETLAATLLEEYEDGLLVCEDETFAKEVLESMRTLKTLLTGEKTEAFSFDFPVTYCPTIDKFNTEEERATYDEIMREFETRYEEEGERWCYHCMNPDSPYPTFHIEDKLLTSRMLGWMMYNYDIVGSLYWDVTLYAWRQDNVNNLPLQDYYGTAHRFPDANGDGWVLYPGKPYGIEGPVGSIRLHSFRDGMEDYEILYALEQEYEKIATAIGTEYDEDSFEALMSLLSIRLYNGTRTLLDENIEDEFMETRELLAGLLDLTTKTQTVVESFTLENGKAKIVFETAAGNLVKENGKALAGTTENGRTTYTFVKELTETTNYFDLSVENGESQAYGVKVYLSRKLTAYNMAQYADKFTMLTGNETGAQDSVDGFALYKVTVPAAIADGEGNLPKVGFNIDVSALNITKDKNSIELNLYNYGDEVTTVELYGKGAGGRGFYFIVSITLKPGMNTVVYQSTTYSILQGAFQTMRICTDATKETTVGIGDIIVEG